MQVLIGGKLTHEIISLEDDLPYYGEREEVFLFFYIFIAIFYYIFRNKK